MPAHRVVLWGHGLGSALAAGLCTYLVRKGTPPACLVLEAPFMSAAHVVASRFPEEVLGVPVADAVRAYADDVIRSHRYDLVERLAGLAESADVPVLILGAAKDVVVPPEHAHRLADYASTWSASPRILHRQLDCGHDDIPDSPAFVPVVSSFLETALLAASARSPSHAASAAASSAPGRKATRTFSNDFSPIVGRLPSALSGDPRAGESPGRRSEDERDDDLAWA